MPSNPADGPAPGRPGAGSNIPAGPAGVPMTPGGSMGGPRTGHPTVTVGTYADYESAQRVVDYLSDNQFPVEYTAIIGTDLRLVEKVLGRMTTARAALAGAASGAWFGLLIGLLLSIFTVSAWWALLLAGLVIGAVWGAVFGAIAHAATGGQRDFDSRSQIVAGRYDVVVDADRAEQARHLLSRLGSPASGVGTG
ncbi:general stress protein [Planosporangium sp. 12N6]|uniref:general stress protein n=1 Tax=Planosporangium spinosum TaxID=3402278 RepID=UPI003CFA974D